MISGLATPIRAIELTPGSALRLPSVSWPQYLDLLADLGEDRATRVAYRDGVLEIRMPGPLHEVLTQLLSAIIFALAEEYGWDCNGLGSLRLNRPDLDQGIEPDACFYVQNAQIGQGIVVPLAPDLPPDLVLEVDIASRSDHKLPIYQAMGVPEIWLCRQDLLTILGLTGGAYHSQTYSQAFPQVSADRLNGWIQQRKTGTDMTVIRAVRQFCRVKGDPC